MSKLSGVSPSADELAEARCILSMRTTTTVRRRRSMQVSPTDFELTATLTKKEKLKGLRDADRDSYIEKYLAFQMQQKDAKSETTSSKLTFVKRRDHQEVHEWDSEKFCNEIGTKRARAWIDSGKFEVSQTRSQETKTETCGHILCPWSEIRQ